MNKETFVTLAHYNREVNGVLQTLLAEHEQLCIEPETTYFGSVTDLLMHIASGDTGWLRHLWFAEGPAPRDLHKRVTATAAGKNPSVSAWAEIREEVDAAIDIFCGGLSTDVLVEQVRLRSPSGDAYSLPRWQCLLHMFNHQTHHRGQLAQVLDERGVENDYSNLFRYLL